jgi:predicted dehydrogenase
MPVFKAILNFYCAKITKASAQNWLPLHKIIPMLKIGVLGAGHLGKIHIKCIKQIPNFELIGFFDTDTETAEKVSAEFQLKAFESIESLIDAADVVDIVTPTVSHYTCASQALRKSRHVFIEKPIVATPAEALSLMELAKEAQVKVQVGHVERFNPAFIAVQPIIKNPMFIETHRLAMFNPRGTDVPVVLDLMVHDIDIILSVIRSSIKKISASGVSVVSDTPDIANARIEFTNGAVANLTASRISLKNMRKSRFFQKDAYITVDFLEKKAEVVRMNSIDKEPENPMSMVIDLGTGKGMKEIIFDQPEVKPSNAIVAELESFYNAIASNQTPPVSIEDGYNVLDVAYHILEKVNSTSSKLQ